MGKTLIETPIWHVSLRLRFFLKTWTFQVKLRHLPTFFSVNRFLKKIFLLKKRIYCSHSLDALDFRPFEGNKKLSTDQLSALTVSNDKIKIGCLLTNIFSSKTFNLFLLHHNIIFKFGYFLEHLIHFATYNFFQVFIDQVTGLFTVTQSTVSVSPGDSVTWRT